MPVLELPALEELSEVPVPVLEELSEVLVLELLVLAVLGEVPVFELPALAVLSEVPVLVLAVPALAAPARDCFHSIPASSAAATFRRSSLASGFWELSGPVLLPGLASGFWEPVLRPGWASGFWEPVPGPDSASGFWELPAAVLPPAAGKSLHEPWGRMRKVRPAPPLWPVQSQPRRFLQPASPLLALGRWRAKPLVASGWAPEERRDDLQPGWEGPRRFGEPEVLPESETLLPKP